MTQPVLSADESDAALGPFDDPAWRSDLDALRWTASVAAQTWAMDARAVVSLAARVPRSPGDERGGTPWTSFVREVALAKRTSDRAAAAEVALAHALLARFPALLAALDAGSVPVHRARLLVELCGRHVDAVAAVADRLLVPRLVSLPPWRIRSEVDLLAARLDPDGAARREAVATSGRTAAKQALDDGQAEVALTGPAVLVQRWWDALTDQARRLKAAGDPRSLGALRFDLAVHTDPRGLVGHDALAAAVGIPAPQAAPAADAPAPPGPGTLAGRDGGTGTDARCARPVQVRVTVPATTALGLLDEPGWLDGHGWISAPLSRSLMTVAELRKAVVASHSGQLVDLADQAVRPRAATGPGAARAAVRGMVLDEHALRSVVTEAQEAHDPSPALEAFVHARDRWCDGPTGTQVPAARTDTDHERAHPRGPTAAWNLVSRSARTHQLKHAGWSAVRDATGTTWTSPAGQTAHHPRHDHPPVPPPPGARPPDPDALAARDRALVAVPERPDERRDHQRPDHERSRWAEPAHGSPQPDRPRARWSDDVPF